MALIRFKTRDLIRRFGTDPVEINDSLAKRYLDRGQALRVKERKADFVIEAVVEEEVGSGESHEEVVEEVEEEKVEVKIKKKKDKGK